MEVLNDQEQRTRKAYRLILVLGILLAVGITIWITRPVEPVDLRFLDTLKPIAKAGGPDGRTLTYKLPAARVERLIDANLTLAKHWRKNGSGGFVVYENRGRGMPYVAVTSRGVNLTDVYLSNTARSIVP